GSGVAWDSFPSLRTRQTFTASSGQTTFNFAYTVGFLDVYVNGVKLTDSEFTATNGSTIVLAVGCFVGDIVELVSYNTIASGGGGGGLGNIVDDTTPQLGGNLDVQTNEITTSTTNGNVKLTPNGTGAIEVKGAGGNDGTLQLNCSQNSHGVKIKSPAHSAGASYTLTLP
ncbi:MAG: hypothetical protein VXY27_05385, partial [Thermoproteota archaeon]|nr:hypothetical protein [Thermoproteota archaeon]